MAVKHLGRWKISDPPHPARRRPERSPRGLCAPERAHPCRGSTSCWRCSKKILRSRPGDRACDLLKAMASPQYSAALHDRDAASPGPSAEPVRAQNGPDGQNHARTRDGHQAPRKPG
jgi:hypothetical protein